MITRYVIENGNKLRGIKNKYSSRGNHNIRITNNITEINIVSTLQAEDIDKSTVKSISFGPGVKKISDNCLNGCNNLTSVNCTEVSKIGDYAFLNCNRLTSIQLLTKDYKTQIEEIGVSAFTGTSIQEAYINHKVTAGIRISPYAFAGCNNLSKITLAGFNTTSNREFYNCPNLTSITLANSHGYLGEYVFENCTGLTNVRIPANTYGLNEGTFKGCTNLTSITFDEPSMISWRNSLDNFILSGTSITSLTIPASVNDFSMINNYAFNGMNQLLEIHFNGIPMSKILLNHGSSTSINSKTYQYNIWLIPSDVNETELTGNAVRIPDTYSNILQVATSYNVPMILCTVSNGCSACHNLEKLVSLNEFSNIIKSLNKQYIFVLQRTDKPIQYGMQLRQPSEIILLWYKNNNTTIKRTISSKQYSTNEITNSNAIELANKIRSELETTCVDYNSPSNNSFNGEYITNKWMTNKGDETPRYSKVFSTNEQHTILANVLNYAQTNNIPLIMTLSKKGCPSCEQILKTYNSSEFEDFMKSLTKPYLFVFGKDDSDLKGVYRLLGFNSSNYPRTLLYWKEKDGTEHKEEYIGYRGIQSIIKTWMDDDLKSYQPSITPTSMEEIQLFSGSLITTNCFGLDHDVTIFSNDGKKATFHINGGMSIDPSIIYEQEVIVDKRTTDDFRYGIWYDNAIQLKQYADRNHIPVFIECGSESCQPCQDFHANVYMNQDFQNFVKSKKILFCKVTDEGDNRNTNFNYVYNSWCNQSSSDFPHGRLPLMIFYYNQPLYEYVNEKLIVNDNINIKYIPYQLDDYGHTYSVSQISDMIEDFSIDYIPEEKYTKPQITQYSTNYPRYNVYFNQDNDDYGRYFPVKNLKEDLQVYTLSVYNGDILTQYTVKSGYTDNIPPDGTYQYYTLPQDADDYDNTYQISGILFKVGKSGHNQYKNESFSKPQEINSYINQYGLSPYNSLTSFDSSVYQDGTTTIIPGLEQSDIYNITRTYTFSSPVQLYGHNCSKVILYISADVIYDEISEQYTIVGKQNVLTATSLEYIYDNDGNSSVLWLSSFNNYSKD